MAVFLLLLLFNGGLSSYLRASEAPIFSHSNYGLLLVATLTRITKACCYQVQGRWKQWAERFLLRDYIVFIQIDLIELRI